MADNAMTRRSESRSLAGRPNAPHPFPAFRRDMERLFEDFFSVFGMPIWADGQHGGTQRAVMAPRIDVSESDNEIRIRADLPGVNEEDIDIRLVDDVLTISGEIRAERDENKQDYHLMERARGAFTRSLRLPFQVDASQVQASFNSGVLTITIPKPKEARDREQRIEVRREQAGASGEPSGAQGTASGSQQAAASANHQAGTEHSAAEHRQPETAAE